MGVAIERGLGYHYDETARGPAGPRSRCHEVLLAEPALKEVLENLPIDYLYIKYGKSRVQINRQKRV